MLQRNTSVYLGPILSARDKYILPEDLNIKEGAMVKVKWLASLILLVIAVQPIFILSSSNALQAQQAPTQGKQRVPTQPTRITRNPPAMEIKVETFRKQIIPGTAIGVFADITNNSSAPIYLRERDVHLVLPPEVENPEVGQYSTDGWFPTEYNLAQPRVISLKPNETYRVFWTRSPDTIPDAEGTSQQDAGTEPGKRSAFSGFRRWFQFISFTPGAYPIMVEAKYWDRRNFDGDDYHTAIETKTVDFAAPQSVILLGAALGGLIFTVLGMVRAEQSAVSGVQTGRLGFAKAFGKTVAILVGSILLSLIITILLSRIAETQFFIKVSVSDFWGAIAVGFLANYGGWTLLDKMVPGGSKGGAAKKNSEMKADSSDAQATNSSAGG